MSDRYAALAARFAGRLLRQEPLARYTAARLGGPAEALLVVHAVDELVAAARWAWAQAVPCRILGGGANVLPADEGFAGLIIINKAAQVQLDESGVVNAESGANLSTLARRCLNRGLGGLEWSVSVPGTVGGAAINNAGAHGGDMSQSLRSAVVHWADRSESWPLAQMQYGYRASALKGCAEPFVLSLVTLQLTPDCDPAALRARADDFVAHRKRTQPPGASLGSIFKNPPGDYAGRLIEAAGLKGRQIGQVQISPLHANFMINLGGGSAADYRSLIELARRTVQDQFGITLETEIELI